jgi:hypothetical protein
MIPAPNREPVAIASILRMAILAIVPVLRAAGITVTEELVVAILGCLIVVEPVLAWIVRGRVTPWPTEAEQIAIAIPPSSAQPTDETSEHEARMVEYLKNPTDEPGPGRVSP